MIEIAIPGHGKLKLKHLVLDYNGTLAVDGRLLAGVRDALVELANELEVHVLTADTFGIARAGLEGVPCTLTILPADGQDAGKAAYVDELGPKHTVAIGNGRNDRLMLEKAALGIAVVQAEGASTRALLAADVACAGIMDALALLSNPLRLVATLRS